LPDEDENTNKEEEDFLRKLGRDKINRISLQRFVPPFLVSLLLILRKITYIKYEAVRIAGLDENFQGLLNNDWPILY